MLLFKVWLPFSPSLITHIPWRALVPVQLSSHTALTIKWFMCRQLKIMRSATFTICKFWFFCWRTSRSTASHWFCTKGVCGRTVHIKWDQILFSILVHVDKTMCLVCIRNMAWPAVVSNLKYFNIIKVSVQPELHVEHVDGPPWYEMVSKMEEGKPMGKERPT